MKPIWEDAYRVGTHKHDIAFRAEQMEALSKGLQTKALKTKATKAAKLLREAEGLAGELAQEIADALHDGKAVL